MSRTHARTHASMHACTIAFMGPHTQTLTQTQTHKNYEISKMAEPVYTALGNELSDLIQTIAFNNCVVMCFTVQGTVNLW